MRLSIAVSTALLGLIASSQSVQAQEKHPFQISLITPAQIVKAEDAIGGIRLNLIYGRNAYFEGLDVGLINHTTSGTSKGLQIGIVGLVEHDFVGVQNNFVNVVEGKFEGFQYGLYNGTETGGGFQLGLVNTAQNFKGLQIGLVNYARQLHGLQIGLVNVISQDGAFPVFPIVNWSF